MAATGFRAQLSRVFRRALAGRPKAAPTTPARPRPQAPSGPKASSGPAARPRPQAPAGGRPEPRTGTYAGDYTGKVKLQYAPQADGEPDPGEVVWAWVPFEEDHGQGKDRPVLVIARNGRRLLGLMLTSKDHDRDLDHEARQGRHWLDLGPGAWDRENRPSEVRLDRILQLDPAAVRREGAVLDRATFDRVAVGIRRANRW